MAVILAIVIGQIGSARASRCPTVTDRAAACRCCAAAKAKPVVELDATIRGRCCAIETEEQHGVVPEPLARCAEAPLAIVPTPLVIVSDARRIDAATWTAVVIARASGPPLWLTTRSLRW